MKKNILLAFIALAFCFNLNAKDIKGKIIYWDGKELEVTFDLPVDLFSKEVRYYDVDRKVKYYDANDKKQTLKANEAKELRFTHNDEDVIMLSCEAKFSTSERLSLLDSKSDVFARNQLGKTNSEKMIFMKLEQDGKMQLLRYYNTGSSFGNMMKANSSAAAMPGGGVPSKPEKEDVLRDWDGNLLIVKDFGFKKQMSEFFGSCPKLVDKIENKEFKKKQLAEIVKYYNEQCK